MRRFVLAIACIAMTGVMAEQLHAGVIITYYDDGVDLFFDYAGSLDADTGTGTIVNENFSVISAIGTAQTVFYSTANGYVFVGNDNGAKPQGLFATNIRTDFTPQDGYSSGTGFMFGVNHTTDGTTVTNVSVSVWGNWGAANTPINGRLVLPGQTVLGIGMVDGWSAQTEWGTITFRDAASVSTVPEPTSLAIFGIGALGLVASRRRRKDKVDLV
ncbi:PEP-CTERM sorting domain-containing protein [Rosistilla oblonga]|uniref:PEP-CTERM sorting domain-containing protein n=1 Tax=Rosistilla oblonga TaxID=2527990 RepID=UPI003A981577